MTFKHCYILLFFVFVVATLSGCLSEKKLAQKCATLYPVKERVVTKEKRIVDTLILPDSWVEVEYVDTTICPPSPVRDTIIKTVIKIKRIPGEVIYHETICIDTVMVQENTAALRLKELEADKWQRRSEKAKRISSIWMWIAIGLGVVLLLSIVLRGVIRVPSRKS